MRGLALLLLAVLLAACSSAPPRTVRAGGTTSTAGAYHPPPPGFPNFVDHSVGREEISIQAMGLVGVPYRWGGNTPDSGFDCSGLVHYVVQRAASVNLPRTTADMSSRGTSIEPDEIAAGDLVFFNTTGRPHSHVGIYVGKLRFVNAPSTGGTVRLDYLTNPYWAKRFDGIRRVAAPLAPPKPTPFDGPTYDASVPPSRDGEAMAAPVAASVSTSTVAASGATSGANSVAASGAAQPFASERAQAPLTAARDGRVTAASRAPAGAAAGAGAGVNAGGSEAATPVDAFEPPPSAMTAAQSQARAAGAVSPAAVVASPESASVYGASSGNAMGTQAQAAQAPSSAYADAPVRTPPQTRAIATRSSAPATPDPIDAAADAYEPPPSSAALAASQAQQAQSVPPASEWQRPPQTGGGVQIMRASTASRGLPAPSQTTDDPIAGFANSRY
ncbi:C40 family peptidase [Paraburkholderia solisilvae]|uniref:C40 family peptidase n=1 Tax=Paraburkholderia solisilvae TaxID=624376 RepID=UPI001581EE7F|nr:C40 family peptidase [Paraburkholderia solisilvae]